MIFALQLARHGISVSDWNAMIAQYLYELRLDAADLIASFS